ncbi:MAG: HAD-IA family hydrolase [Clostridiales bacterium]|nr:HAD-IA family hydrolase [Clostridiales bacterium]
MSQVILFDLDGTLTESGEGITKCVQYALGKLGIEENDLDRLRCFVGPPLKEQFMAYAGLDDEQAEQAVEYYRERYTTVGIFENHLYPKIPELLEVLKINDKILGVATSKPEKFAKQILEYFNIEQYFQVIVGSEMDGKRTNKAEVIEEALNRLQMQEERDKILMVGDKEHDVLGATSCGIRCVGVTYGYGSREELEEAGAVYIADTVEDLGILASPNDEETTEHVESVRKPLRIRKEKRNKGKQEPSGQEKKETAEEPQEADPLPAVTARPMHPLLQLWRVIYPIFLHGGAAFLVMFAFTYYYLERVKAGAQFDILEQVTKSSLLQLIPTSLIAGGAALFFYQRDQKKRKAGFLGNGADFVWSPPVIWFSVIVLAIAGSQILNDLILIFRLNEIFPSYAELTDETMVDQPIWLLMLTIGILAPITEELIFRGLIFRRLKDFIKPVPAIIISSLVFGLYHGNMVQFLYASLLGSLLAIIYNRTGTLWTAIVAHMAANLWSLFGGGWWYLFMERLPFGIWLGILIELLLCVIPAYWIFGKRSGR